MGGKILENLANSWLFAKNSTAHIYKYSEIPKFWTVEVFLLLSGVTKTIMMKESQEVFLMLMVI